MALLCKAHALSDLDIRVRSLTRAGDLPIKKLPCRVQSIERAASDVIVLKVKLPASDTFRFRAGQYIDFLLEGGRRRSFSIANAPAAADHLELHIRRIDGGSFTGHVFDAMKEKDILRFEGPLGSFGFGPGERAAVLIAGGTGFAPVKSMVEDLIASGRQRPLTLYWGSRTREGLYMDELARTWEQALPGFRYIPVLSEPAPEDGWTGRIGLVHHAVMADLPDLSSHEAYACGSPAMIDAARADLVSRCGLPADAFFADAFTFASA
jgi:CDP-4-dehydro-6-deoxyglucose reductase, E3